MLTLRIKKVTCQKCTKQYDGIPLPFLQLDIQKFQAMKSEIICYGKDITEIKKSCIKKQNKVCMDQYKWSGDKRRIMT